MKKKLFMRVFLGLIALYALLFIARAAYALCTDEVVQIGYTNDYGSQSYELSVRNYASQAMPGKGATTTANAVMDQKYESIASIVAKTSNYDADMQKFKDILGQNSAVIQMQNQRGLAGSRRADMTIGVRPENFAAMEEAVRGLGHLLSHTVTTNDKTYEYRQMLAEKTTLERRRQSYEALKERSGSISELIALEDKIIEVDSQIQDQLVNLGEYSDDNALCTINFSLYEGSSAGALYKLIGALEWATLRFFAVVGVLVFIAVAAVILAAIWGYFRKFFAEKTTEQSAVLPAQQEKTE